MNMDRPEKIEINCDTVAASSEMPAHTGVMPKRDVQVSRGRVENTRVETDSNVSISGQPKSVFFFFFMKENVYYINDNK